MPPADYYPVTINTNGTPLINKVVSKCAARFKRLNGHEVRIIGNGDVAKSDRAQDLPHPRFTKTLLWDFVPEHVNTLLYYDRDVVPVRPIGKLPESVFSAALDHAPGLMHAKKIWPLFKRTGIYFNSGVMIVRREARCVFDAVYGLASCKQDVRGLYDQSLFNIMAQHMCKVTVLPKAWNYCPAIEDDIITEPMMVHCCGTMRPYTLAQYVLAEAERILP